MDNLYTHESIGKVILDKVYTWAIPRNELLRCHESLVASSVLVTDIQIWAHKSLCDKSLTSRPSEIISTGDHKGYCYCNIGHSNISHLHFEFVEMECQAKEIRI